MIKNKEITTKSGYHVLHVVNHHGTLVLKDVNGYFVALEKEYIQELKQAIDEVMKS